MTELAPLGLYIHWPYCQRICPYCDFNVYRARGEDGDGLVDAMLRDLEQWHERIEPRPLVSIHFGGGTPSLMTDRQVGRIISQADALFGLGSECEIGLEANPKEGDHLASLAAAGINRLSLGVQTFIESDLKLLGRDHDGALARKAFDQARQIFQRTSLDLIYARPGQSANQWEAELAAILTEQPDHLSAYQLTIEPGTAFDRQERRGQLSLPEEDGAMYELTRLMCEDAGLPAYEISNHAKSAEHQSVHNRLYWTGGDWIGIGPGAHSRVGRSDQTGRLAAEAVKRPDAYIRLALSTGAQDIDVLSALDEARERLLMGLRLSEGLDRADLRSMTGHDVELSALETHSRDGRVSIEGDRIRIVPESRIYADRISNDLAP